MNLKDILAISGESGLFRFLAQGRNAIIVEHLETGKRQTASGSAKVSSLEEIAIFTQGEDMKLSEIFDKIFEKEKGGPAIDSKSQPRELTAYFAEVVPEYDRDRVYSSDIKKVLQWYNILHKLNLLVKEEAPTEPSADETPKDDIRTEPAGEVKKAARIHDKKSVVKKGAGTKAPKRMPPSQRKSG
ncbi:MAG: DUF5606 domain-containing protein [Bacteroidales bacterium]|nr:DUF5606 domain-containing protein [Bacteroidales bacterium]